MRGTALDPGDFGDFGDLGDISDPSQLIDLLDKFNLSGIIEPGMPSSVMAKLTLTNVGVIATSGDYASAISAAAVGVTTGSGSYAAAYSTLDNYGAVATVGKYANGISLRSRAENHGDDGYASAIASVLNVAPIMVSGDYSSGIQVAAIAVAYGDRSSAIGSVSLFNVGDVSATGKYAHALSVVAGGLAFGANSQGYGTVDVFNSADLVATGEGSRGIWVRNIIPHTVAAPTTITTRGDITATGVGGQAIYADGGDVLITVGGGTLTGGTTKTYTYNGYTYGSYGAGIYASGWYSTTLVNSGTITALSDRALWLRSDGAVNVTNRGTLDGYLLLSGDTGSNFTNSGTWYAHGADSDFGSTGSRIAVNNATGRFIVMGDQIWNGLTRTTNLGLISLAEADAPAGRGGATFETLTLSGDFVGGGTLALDADLGTGQSDRINIGGNVSGAPTAIVLSIPAMTQAAPTSGNGIVLVHVGGTSADGDFNVVGNTADNRLVAGAYEFDLNRLAGSGNDFALQSKVFNGVFEYPALGAATASAFALTNVSFSDLLSLLPGEGGQQMALNDHPVRLASADSSFAPYTFSQAGQFGIWARYTFGDMKESPNGASDYKLHTVTGQVGFDYAAPLLGGLGIVGVYAARGDSEIDLSGSTTNGKARTSLYGGYGLWQGGPWKAAVMGSFGTTRSDFTAPLTGTHNTTSPGSTSVNGMVSYRAVFTDAIIVSPRLEFGYSESSGYDFLDFTGTNVSISDTRTTVIGGAARTSKVFGFAGGNIEPFLDLGFQQKIGAKTTARVSGLTFASDVEGFTGLLGIGARVRLGDSIAFTASANLQGGGRENGAQGMISLRYVH
jgi:hypothetical protein